jgi:hypothetical protein
LFLVVAAVGVVAATVILVVGRDTSDRPRELDMAAVPPCELISQEALLELNTTHLGDPDDVSSEFGEEGTGCRYFVRDGATLNLKEVTNYGIDRWTDGDVRRTTFEDVARIGGFRTVKVWHSAEQDRPDYVCRIYVDVADDQSLKVDMHDVDRRESSPPVCDVVYRAAEAAMRTLIDQAGPAKR